MQDRITTRIIEPAKSLLKAGMSPEKVALSIALGIALGTIPLIGTSTALCAIAAVVLRLNLPVIQTVNYAVYPLQIILLAPFIGTGSRLFGDRHAINVGREVVHQLQHDPWGSLASLWQLLLYGVGVWAIASPLMVVLVYTLLKPAVSSLAANPRTKSVLIRN